MTIDMAFERLGKSKFRSRFKLTAADVAYIDRVGMEKWWNVPKGRPLSATQQAKAVKMIMAWIRRRAPRISAAE